MLRHYRNDLLTIFLLMIVGIGIFAPMMLHWREAGDYVVHNQLAVQFINDTGTFIRNTPHFLYHVLTGIVNILAPVRIGTAGAIVMLAADLALLLIIYWRFRQHKPALRFGLITLALIPILVMPFNLLTPENLYFGYFAPNVYHNPTVILMKPFSVALFFVAIYLYTQHGKQRAWWWLFPIALLTALGIVAKPSFVLSFIPALGLVTGFLLVRQVVIEWRNRQAEDSLLHVVWHSWQRTPVNWWLLLGGITLPTLAILYYQTQTWTSSAGISIEPFRVFFEWTLHFEPNADKQILLKLVMSCLFPLVVYVLHIKDTWRNLSFNLAWLNFAVSVAYAYLLVDNTAIGAGDFGWSAQSAALLLYIVGIDYLLQRYDWAEAARNPRIWLCLAVLILHLMSGLHWYHLHYTQDYGQLINGWW